MRRTLLGAGGLVLVLALALLLGILLGGCSGDDDDDVVAGTSAARLAEQIVDRRGEARVEIASRDNAFTPAAVRIDPGTVVRWENQGRNPHDITPQAVSGSPDGVPFGVLAADFKPDDTYDFQFDEPGVYNYYCALHGTEDDGMIGLVVVGDAEVTDVEITAPATSAAGDETVTIEVPGDYPTIQAAVDAAAPGSLVLISPGTYNEAVTVTTENLVIRGLDRNETILDGEFTLDNGFKVLADGVAIENLTAQNFTLNGFFWTGVTGYRGSYLNAIRNGDYAIYAFDSTKGQFDHSYTSGSPDAGFYIGQCYPCDAVITDVIAEWNGLGYSGTNAGGNLLIVNSTWRLNRAGIVPNSGSYEELAPERETTIAGNRVYANSNGDTAAIEIAQTASGNGILLAGGNDNIVLRNLVYDHDIAGIATVPLPEKLLNPDDPNAVNFDARGNEVRDNVLRDNRAFDLAVVTSVDDASDSGGNCFAGNDFTTSEPEGIETLAPCDAAASPSFTVDIGRFLGLLGGEKPPSVDYQSVALPDPGDQPEMPDAATAPARPANKGVPVRIDLDDIKTPTG